MSELAHMRKLYNDIIYFVQNHVKPVAPSNSYHSSLFLSNSSPPPSAAAAASMLHKPIMNNNLIGYNHIIGQNPKQGNGFPNSFNTNNNSSSSPSKSSVTILEEAAEVEACRTKLFGVPLMSSSKKRVHPEYNSSVETNKARMVLEKDDLGFNLMPPSC